MASSSSFDDDGDDDTRPRFFKVFISHFSSDYMLIPISYYDELPYRLPKTAILRGSGGCVWNVAIEIKKKQKEVHFGKGWTKFVKDNSLKDGDFLTFVYNGESVFEVSIYGCDGCKEIRAVAEEQEEEDSIWSLSSKDTNTYYESDMANVKDSNDNEESVYSLNSEEDSDTEVEMVDAIPRSKNKGKSKIVEEDSDDIEDSVYYQDSEEDTDSEFKMSNTISGSKKKGKKKETSDDEDSDSDYNEAFSNLDFEDSSNSDTSYLPDSEDTTANVKPKAKKPKKKGKSKVVDDMDTDSDSSGSVELGKIRKKVKAKIKNPERYLDNPENVYFETQIKNRIYELLVHAQLVKDYCLKFQDHIRYIDPKGELEAKTAKWKDQRVCIKRWHRIRERNNLKKKDRILCELLRKKNLVYAIKLHIIREADL